MRILPFLSLFLFSVCFSQNISTRILSCSNSDVPSAVGNGCTAGVSYNTNAGAYSLVCVSSCGGSGAPNVVSSFSLSGVSLVSWEASTSCSMPIYPDGVDVCVGSSNPQGFCNCMNSFATSASVSGMVYLTVSSPTLPQCSDLFSVDAPACKGGKGLWLQTTEANEGAVIGGTFGASEVVGVINGTFVHEFLNSQGGYLKSFSHYQTANFDTLSRPDGSQCVSNTTGQIFDFVVCPLGFETLPEESSSSSAEETSSSSGGEDGDSSSSGERDVCREFPNLPGCAPSPDSTLCDKFPYLPECTGGAGGDCVHLSNCDWAKLTVQLIQLDVETEIRDKIKEAVDLLQSGYNLSQEQNGLLNGVIGAVNSGTGDIVGAINGLLSGLAGNGDGTGGIANGVADGLSQFGNDTAGTGFLDSLLGSFGGSSGSGGEMGDSLGDGSGARSKIKAAVGIDSSSFSFLGNNGNCPQYDFTFASGVMGIGTDKKVDLCDISGFNAGAVMKAILWLVVLITTLFFDLELLRKGGH